jgi:hypothetical protein
VCMVPRREIVGFSLVKLVCSRLVTFWINLWNIFSLLKVLWDLTWRIVGVLNPRVVISVSSIVGGFL